MPDVPDNRLIVLITLGQYHAEGYGVGGYCSACRRLFDIDMAALVAEHGADFPMARRKSVRCPRCGGTEVSTSVIAPDRRAHRRS